MDSVLSTALHALECGLAPFPARTDGTKAPRGQWKKYQQQRLTADEVQQTFQDHPNLGLICGSISGNVVCLEFEGRFMDRWDAVRSHLQACGLWSDVYDWMNGYSETSPSGGLHILVRVDDGIVPANTKVAMAEPDEDGVSETLIEVRGEGGYIVIAPSGGPTHPSEKPWTLVRGDLSTIATTTSERWLEVLDSLMLFDETPPSPEPPPPTRRPRLGDGWVERALDEQRPIEEALSSHGWLYVRSDDRGQLWRRPGKRHGVSGRVNTTGRLMVFSSSTPFPIGKRTFDSLDVDLTYDYGRPPTLDERTERLRGLRQTPEPARPVSAAGADQTPPPALEGTANLPPAFWEARPYLSELRSAALANLRSPDGLWEAFKVFYAATIPHNFLLPGDGTLDYISLIVGPSGTGKTRSKNLALSLLPPEAFDIDGVTLGLPPGTGEGMIEWYIKRDKDGKQMLANRGGGFYVDEGKWLIDVNGRQGNTTVQMLKQMWSGELTGSLNASSDRIRVLAPRSVRGAVLISATPDIFAAFLQGGLEEGGFPQRVSVGSATHPEIGDNLETEWTGGHLDVPIFNHNKYGSSSGMIYRLEYEPELASWLRSREIARLRGEAVSVADGHADFAQVKTAALLALMDGRMTVTYQDLVLAQLDWTTTRTLREQALASQRSRFSIAATAAGRSQAVAAEAALEHHLESATLRVGRKVQDSTMPMTRREIKDMLGGRIKSFGVDWRETIEVAMRRGWIVEASDGYVAGPVQVH